MRASRPAPWMGFGLSLLLHALAGTALLTLPGNAAPPTLEVRLLGSGEGTPRGDAAPRPSGNAAQPPRPGGEHPDLLGPPAPHGGRPAPAVPIVHLVRTPSPLAMQEGVGTTPEAQLQRIHTAPRARSPLPRRATPSPGVSRFLASGTGRIRRRAPLARHEARTGAPSPHPGHRAPQPLSEFGDARRSRPRPGPRRGTSSPPVRAALEETSWREVHRGAPRARPGTEEGPRLGLAEPQGRTASPRSAVAHGRPPLPRGPAATLAPPGRRPSDRSDARRLADPRLTGSMADASRARTTIRGTGSGQGPGRRRPGPGGVGRGAGRARAALGEGDGTAIWKSPAYWRWYREQRARVERAVRFPRARALALDQGTTLLKLWVRRDGSLSSPPRLLRSSGFEDLDAEALAAVQRVLPFAPLPADLAPEQEQVAILLSVEFSNPMVH